MNDRRDEHFQTFVIVLLSLVVGLLLSIAIFAGDIRTTLDRAYPPPKESSK